MAISTKAGGADQSAAISGLDSLELAKQQEGSRGARIARKTWRGAWPKLLAIAIVLAAWQLFYASNFHGDTADNFVRSPAFTLAHSVGNLGTASSGVRSATHSRRR